MHLNALILRSRASGVSKDEGREERVGFLNLARRPVTPPAPR